jgi:hypothetical protein
MYRAYITLFTIDKLSKIQKKEGTKLPPYNY